ncbi:murein hydrolase activator EnvC family protein [Altererythrobacter sp. CAU 1778]
MTPRLPAILLFSVTLAGFAAFGPPVLGQRSAGYTDAAQSRAALDRALAQQSSAAKRAETLERRARSATQTAQKTTQEAAAIAARIQQSEAGLAVAEARMGLIAGQQRAIRTRMAKRQKPVVGLTAALQRFARRPAALSVFRPGSVKDAVYLRVMLANAAPEVARRTADLRADLDRSRALQREAQQAIEVLRTGEGELAQRQQQLAALATKQRLAARDLAGTAGRESERALALAEEARDLDALVDRLDEAGELRERLAALPGPVLRPAQPQRAVTAEVAPLRSADRGAPRPYRAPVDGRTLAGFGAIADTGLLSEGVVLAPRPGAQIVTPGAGRVAFAGPYRGYGRIVIVDHGGGWVSLITGMVRVDVEVGENLVSGSPLGVAAPDRPAVALELRRNGEPVNPLDYIG